MLVPTNAGRTKTHPSLPYLIQKNVPSLFRDPKKKDKKNNYSKISTALALKPSSLDIMEREVIIFASMWQPPQIINKQHNIITKERSFQKGF